MTFHLSIHAPLLEQIFITTETSNTIIFPFYTNMCVCSPVLKISISSILEEHSTTELHL